MHAAHNKFGVRWKGSRRGTFAPHTVTAYADSCCQTCTAGTDLLEQIGVPESYLVPTRHRIVGITNSALDISGALLLRIEVAGKITRQMVHVSRNTHGLYLSERAMLDLGLLPEGFPGISKSQAAPESVENCSRSTSAAASCDEDDALCVERTPTPDIPEELPFPATKENLPRFEQYFLSTFKSSAFNTCTHQSLQELSGAAMDIVFKDGAVQ